MPNQDIDLLSVGDATLDVFLTPSETETVCSLDTKECLICFSYGDKIPVKNIDYSIGGNAANNVVGTKRLGVKSALVLTLGDDLVGNQIVEKLGKDEINLTYVIQQPSTTSNYSMVVSYGGERTIFVYHAPRSYEFPVSLPKVPWVYLTSMGEAFQPFYNHMLEWFEKKPEVKVAFNPGSYQLRAKKEILEPILKRTYLLYVNRQEAEKLTGLGNSNGKEKDLLRAVSALGPKIPVVTDGGRGSFAYDGEKFYTANTMPVDAYERTGAGDAYGSGFLSAVIKGRSIAEAMVWGTVNSASVIGYTGAQKGLLRADQIDEWLSMAASSGVKVEEF